jgi:hypothetical protein
MAIDLYDYKFRNVSFTNSDKNVFFYFMYHLKLPRRINVLKSSRAISFSSELGSGRAIPQAKVRATYSGALRLMPSEFIEIRGR